MTVKTLISIALTALSLNAAASCNQPGDNCSDTIRVVMAEYTSKMIKGNSIAIYPNKDTNWEIGAYEYSPQVIIIGKIALVKVTGCTYTQLPGEKTNHPVALISQTLRLGTHILVKDHACEVTFVQKL